ncbi:PREDICTED: probable phospholipid-transporting ATPase IIB, partial [Charadrius vociferus]|uniref:probable phospholipid-transporting ATPase IIB n=1 Tax=Charadrius vociferus TaxID=50402 RepID=UPI00052141C1
MRFRRGPLLIGSSNYLEEEVVVKALQDPSGLLMSFCVIPPADIRVVEVPHEHQGLRMRGGSCLLVKKLHLLVLSVQVIDSWHPLYQVEDESSHLDEMPLMMSEEGFENDESDYHTLPRARISQRRRGLEWFICGGWKFLCTSCSDWLINICRRKKELKARTVWLGCPEKCEEKYPKNAIKNQKYNVFTFIPGVLYEQFKFFLNLYFLVVSCSQFVPALKIGYLYTYWAPL